MCCKKDNTCSVSSNHINVDNCLKDQVLKTKNNSLSSIQTRRNQTSLHHLPSFSKVLHLEISAILTPDGSLAPLLICNMFKHQNRHQSTPAGL